MPFFSIIVPSYNRASFIEKTIESVQNQIFKDWECIIVDDGSTDNTENVVGKISQKDKRIRYIYQENAERSAARNKGIKNAIGEYVCFLDSDDSYLEDHLYLLHEKIITQSKPKAMFFTNYILSFKNELIHQKIPSVGENTLHYLFYNPIIPARVCIHSKILEKEMFDEEIVVVEDLLLWVRIALSFPVIQIEKETVIYNMHEDNSVNIKNNSGFKRLNGLVVFFKKYPEMNSKIPSDLKNFVLGDTHFGVAKYYIFTKNKRMALKHLMLSIRFQKIHSQLKHKIFIVSRIVLNKTIPEYQNLN